MDTIILPTVAGMKADGVPYHGVCAGLMLTNQGPKLIEYNVRFGDPEVPGTNDTIDVRSRASFGRDMRWRVERF